MLTAVIVAAIVLIAIAYGYLRSQSVRKIEEDLLPLLPPENSLSWRLPKNHTVIPESISSSPHPQDNRAVSPHAESLAAPRYPENSPSRFGTPVVDWELELGLTGAAMDGVVQVAPLLAQLEMIDISLLRMGIEKTIKFITKIPSFDMQIGHMMIGAEHGHEAWIGFLGAFLAKHGAFSGIDHVVAAKAAAVDMAHQAGVSAVDAHHGIAEGILHGASGGEHVVSAAGAHIPVVTLLFSSYREFQLLTDEKTTFLRAAAHVAVDGAAVAGGGLAGAKAGAVIGTFFGPGPGTAIGAAIGGVIGSIGGKLGAAKIRMVRFESAKSKYLASVDHANQHIASLCAQQKVQTRRMQEDSGREFEAGRAALIQNAQVRLSAQVALCQSSVFAMTQAFPERLGQLATQLQNERQAILAAIPQTRYGFLWPSRSDVMRKIADRWFQRAAGLITTEITHYRTLSIQETTVRAAEIKRFLAAFRFQLDLLDQDIRRVSATFEDSKTRVKEIEASLPAQLEQLRKTLVDRFTAGIAAMTDTLSAEMKRKKAEIQHLWDELKVEADAVGISLAPQPS